MNRERFLELEKACKDFCNVRYSGCRQQRDNANEMLLDIIRYENERKKNSKYFVFVRTVNHGTRNFPNLEKALFVESVSGYKETDKCFVSSHNRVSKDSIVAWLS